MALLTEPHAGSPTPNRARRTVRRNRLDERVAAAVGVAAGVVAGFAGAHPTGREAVDAVLVGLAVAVVTWAAASAPWWAIAATAAVAAVIAVDAVLTLVGALAFVVALWIGVRRRDLGSTRAVVAAVALNVIVRAELAGPFGTSALIGIATGVVLFVAGIRRRRRRTRRLAWTAVGVVALGLGVAVVGFGFAAASARTGLLDGSRLAREGIAELSDGDFAAAATRFAAASDAFAAADSDLSRPWARAAAIVPVVAQNGDAVAELAASAATSTGDLGTALAQVDPQRLRLIDGRIDLAAFDSVAGPLASVQSTLAGLRSTVDEVDSPWLVAPLVDRIDQLDADIASNEVALDNAVLAAELAPSLLGADGPQRYLIAFTTPAEARGLGGFMGNFAEVVADQGQLTLTRFGRTGELNLGGDDPEARTVTGPPDWLEQWGRFGFVGAGTGTTGSVPWSNVTMSPHFPSTAAVIAELYPQSGGAPLDGVFAMDPYVLAALVELTGPIEVAATGATLDADELVPFLLEEQYTIGDDIERVDLLEDVAQQTIDGVLAGSLPAPTELAGELGELAREGRLTGWAADPASQELFERIGLAGALPELAGGDGVAVVVNNAGANKIDVYLERDVRYRATVDPTTGETTATVEVTLTNTAPAEGLPPVVIGNGVGEPVGSNRALVSVYTALPVVSATLDGEPLLVETGREQGWSTARTALTIPSGGTRTISLQVAGVLDVADGYVLHTRPQALVAPERHDLAAASTAGDALVAVDEVATVRRRFESSGGDS